MNKIKFPLFLSCILAILFLASFASADISFVPTSQTLNASHNSDLTINFVLNNTGSVNYTAINWSSSTTSKGSWKTLPSSTTLSTGESKAFSAVLSIPACESGSFSANMHATTTPSANADMSLTINILSSSSLDITSVTSLTNSQNGTIKINNTGNVNLNNIALSSTGDFNVSFSANNFALSPGSSATVNVNALTNLKDLGVGQHEITILARDATGVNDTFVYDVENDFCKYGNVNASKVLISNLEDTSSDDEWEWEPLQEVEIEVEVENNLDDDEDFIVALGLYDTVENEFIEIDDEDTLEEEISINEDDSETISFEFKVPADIEESEGRYILYVKALVDGDENTYCNSYSADNVPESSVGDIQIEKEANNIAFDEISSPKLATAGESITISAKVYNIGSEDEDKVRIILTNSKLGLNLESSSFGLDVGESETVDFSFIIPSTAENGDYSFKLVSYYDYKKSSDSYQEISDPSEVKINIAGGTANVTTIKPTSGAATISASLESEAKAGSEMAVKVTVTNPGANAATFVIAVKNYDSWATLSSISDEAFVLNGGESEDIEVKFNVNKDASGKQSFMIETISGSKVDTKEVAVEIETTGSFWSSLGQSLKSKTLIWIIGIVNLALIILIVYFAVKMFKK